MLKFAALFIKSADDAPDKKDRTRTDTVHQIANQGDTYDDATTQAWNVLIRSGPVFM